jgi:hypothetical protein
VVLRVFEVMPKLKTSEALNQLRAWNAVLRDGAGGTRYPKFRIKR